MGNHRMLDKRIINSGKFLQLSLTTQAVYFHLCMNADDDGVVDAYPVIKLIDASPNDIRQLIEYGFVYMLCDDKMLLVYIENWILHNKIRPDRKVDSVYKQLLLSIRPDIPYINARPRADKTNGRPMDNQGTSIGGISKDKLSKDKLSINTRAHDYMKMNNLAEEQILEMNKALYSDSTGGY